MVDYGRVRQPAERRMKFKTSLFAAACAALTCGFGDAAFAQFQPQPAPAAPAIAPPQDIPYPGILKGLNGGRHGPVARHLHCA